MASLTAEEMGVEPLSWFFFPPEIIPDLDHTLFNSDCIFLLRILPDFIYSALNLTAKLISSPSLWLKLSSGLILLQK